MTLVELEKVVKVYRSNGSSVRALDGVTLSIRRGEFMSVAGPYGSGKTTLLNLIGCLDRPTSGRIKIINRNVTHMSPKELDELRLKRIGFVFQTFNLIPTLTALENVELALSLAGLSSSEQRKRAEELLDLVGLGHRIHHRPSQLSAGEAQRVAIARALANDPDLVLADEPTGNLDTERGYEIVGLMRDLNRKFGETFIIVTHDPEIAEMADRVIRLKDGRITSDSKGRSKSKRR